MLMPCKLARTPSLVSCGGKGGHLITSSAQPLFDHLIGEGQERRRHGNAEHLGGPQIYHKLILGRPQDRQIAWLGTQLSDIDASLAIAFSSQSVSRLRHPIDRIPNKRAMRLGNRPPVPKSPMASDTPPRDTSRGFLGDLRTPAPVSRATIMGPPSATIDTEIGSPRHVCFPPG